LYCKPRPTGIADALGCRSAKGTIMPFEYQSFTTKPNLSNTVKFTQPITHYLPGIAYYCLTYGNGDNNHFVQEVALKLSVEGQPSPEELTIKVSGTLQDKSGHAIDNDNSLVTVVVLAWTGADPGTIQLDSASDISHESGPINLVSPSLSAFLTVLAGFRLFYGSNTDHQVLYQEAGVSGKQSGSTGYIVGSAKIRDGSGSTEVVATVNGGLIAIAKDAVPGVEFRLLANQQKKGPFDVQFLKPLKGAAVMLVSEFAAYWDQHHILTIGAGCSGWSVNGDKVQLKDARAFMNDSSGSFQNDYKSNVTILVVGFYI
jgi:hypothetical protein